mmetsp:Transcript_18944/g.33678  ORF Transcript_18944/g.33678 Transcript_18944/m.33678 type:complete len:86 (-) Transcript_18944:21-278(-)
MVCERGTCGVVHEAAFPLGSLTSGAHAGRVFLSLLAFCHRGAVTRLEEAISLAPSPPSPEALSFLMFCLSSKRPRVLRRLLFCDW